MKNLFEIKEEHKSAIVGFNGSGLALGKRTEKELCMLAEMAQYSRGLRKYFVSVPTREQIAAFKEGKFLEATAAPEVVDETTNVEAANEEQKEVLKADEPKPQPKKKGKRKP